MLLYGFPFFLVVLVDGLSRFKQLPDFVIPCVDDANLAKCPAQLLDSLRHRFVQGIPEFRLPPIDPLLLPQLTISRAGSSISDFTTNITNMIWTGAGGFEVLETFANIETLVFRLKLRFPYLQVSADAITDGTVLSFELRGAGTFSCNATKVILDIVLNGERHEHDGREFLTWKREDMEIDYDDFYFVDMRGFLKDTSLTRIFMSAFNKGTRLLSRSQKRLLADSIGTFIIEAINRVHSMYSVDVLYPRS